MSQGKLIAFTSIDTSPARDARAKVRSDVVAEYEQHYRDDVNLGPGTVFYDGKKYWLGDGVHRLTAAAKAGEKGDQFLIEKGGYDEAFAYACRANDTFGARSSNGDKRARTEKYLLRHAKDDPQPSDGLIAKACNVSDDLVCKVRKALAASGQLPTVGSSSRLGVDGKVRDVSHIGKTKGDTSEPAWVETEEDAAPVLTDEDWAEAEKEESDAAKIKRAAKPFDEAIRRLGEWERWVVANIIESDAPGTEFIHADGSDLRIRVSNLRGLLTTRKPHSICPDCQGKGCGTCKQSGFIPRRMAGSRTAVEGAA